MSVDLMAITFDPFIRQRSIDTTAWLGQWPNRLQAQHSVSSLIAVADRFQLEGLCVSPIAALFGFDTLSGNEALFRDCAADARLLPFPLLNPVSSTWRTELEWCRRQGARGIRMAPGYHRCENDLKALIELAQAAKQDALPLQLSVRLMDERIQHPLYQAPTLPLAVAADVAAALQGHPLLISGLRLNEWEDFLRFLPQGTDVSSLFFDLWYCNGPLAVIESLCAKGGDRHFVYGSGTPIQTAEATALQIALAGVTEPQRSFLARGNALRFLGDT